MRVTGFAIKRLEGITRKRAEKKRHDDRQDVESPDVGKLETHVTGALPNDLDQKGQRVRGTGTSRTI